jgi:hypothetical protein
MLRVDLAAAGIPYRDAAGLVFDFHSLRCETATLADAAGVSPRVVQKMMRHSTLELTGRYTRPRAVDIEAAASMLPSLKPAGDRPETLAATGTDASPVLGFSATENATDPEDDGPKPFGGIPVPSGRERTKIRSPQGGVGSSPTFGIPMQRSAPMRRRAAKTPLSQPFPPPGRANPIRGIQPRHRIPTHTEAYPCVHRMLTKLPPADPALREVVAVWDRLPEAVRAGIVAYEISHHRICRRIGTRPCT